MSDACRNFHISVQPQGWAFPATAGQSLLEAARAAGIVFPSSCRNGTCRTCICRMPDGSVSYNIEWPGLSREEKAEGYILPCVASANSNLVLDVPAATKV